MKHILHFVPEDNLYDDTISVNTNIDFPVGCNLVCSISYETLLSAIYLNAHFTMLLLSPNSKHLQFSVAISETLVVYRLLKSYVCSVPRVAFETYTD